MITYQELSVLLTEYQIDLYRYDYYLRSVVNERLDAMQKGLMAKVLLCDLENINKKELDILLHEIRQIIHENYSSIENDLDDGFNQAYVVSIVALAGIYNKWLKANVFATLPKSKLNALKNAPMFEGAKFNDWWKAQEDSYKFKVQRIIRQGTQAEDADFPVTRELTKALELSKTQTRTLINTATSSVSAAAQEKLFELNDDIIEGKQQLSTLDSRTTPMCRARDLLIWTLDNKPMGHNVPFRPIPLHFKCRSIMMAILNVNASKLGTRASEFGQVDANMNYEEFLMQQNNDYQDRVLGKKRAHWFRDGKINLKQMLDSEDRYLTLKELMEKYNVK